MLKYIDFFSDQISFRTKHGGIRFQTNVGGFFSLLVSMTIIAAISYFTSKFFNRTDFNVASSTLKATSPRIANFTDLPLMFRVSLSGSTLIKDSDMIWKFQLTYINFILDENKNLVKKTIFVNLSKCNIDNPIHFNPKYRYLFTEFKDLETFVCTDHIQPLDLYGRYAAPEPNSYFEYYLRPCQNETDKIPGSLHPPCKTAAEINPILDAGYIDIRTISYSVETVAKVPYKIEVENERFSASSSVAKKIWMRYKPVTFISDIGLVFEEKENYNFFTINDYPTEVDLRDTSKGTIPGTYLKVHIINYKDEIVFHRYYSKAQQLVADLGGILKSIQLIGYLLTFYFNLDMFELYLFNNLVDVKKKTLTELLKKEQRENISNLIDNNMYHSIHDINISQVNNTSKVALPEVHSNNVSKFLNSENIINTQQQRPNNETDLNNVSNLKLKSNDVVTQVKLKKVVQDEKEGDELIQSVLKREKDFFLKKSCCTSIFPTAIIPCKNNINLKAIKLAKNEVHNSLDVVKILTSIDQTKSLTKLLLDKDQQKILNYIFEETREVDESGLRYGKNDREIFAEYKLIQNSLNKLQSKEDQISSLLSNFSL